MIRSLALAAAAVALLSTLGVRDAGAGLGSIPTFAFTPAYSAPIARYPYPSLATLDGVKLKTAAQCPAFPGRRGVKLQSLQDVGSGSFAYGVPVGARFDVTALIDVRNLTTPGASAGIEFRTADEASAPSLFVGVARNPDDTFTVFAEDTGNAIGTPQPLAGDVECLTVELDALAGAASASFTVAGGDPVALVEDHPFAIVAPGSFAAGLFDAGNGNSVTVTLAAAGALYDDATEAVLADLLEVAGLQNRAQQDLLGGTSDTAAERLQEADAIFERGTQIPQSDPPAFTGALTPRVLALHPDDAALAKQLAKQLAKSRQGGADVLLLMDAGQGVEAFEALAATLGRTLRARALTETGVAGEKPVLGVANR